jgi:hypothetical protein
MESDNEYSDMADSCEDTNSDAEDEPCFNSEPVRQNTLPYEVLDSAACLALALKEVEELCELLCCSEDVAGILLRQFRWNREKLTEGASSPGARIGFSHAALKRKLAGSWQSAERW